MDGGEGGWGENVIRGDFNARTSREDGREIGREEVVEEEGRRSKDGKRNKEGKRTVEFINEKGWFILNGGVDGDTERE